jgi:hypothetical protein
VEIEMNDVVALGTFGAASGSNFLERVEHRGGLGRTGAQGLDDAELLETLHHTSDQTIGLAIFRIALTALQIIQMQQLGQHALVNPQTDRLAAHLMLNRVFDSFVIADQQISRRRISEASQPRSYGRRIRGLEFFGISEFENVSRASPVNDFECALLSRAVSPGERQRGSVMPIYVGKKFLGLHHHCS